MMTPLDSCYCFCSCTVGEAVVNAKRLLEDEDESDGVVINKSSQDLGFMNIAVPLPSGGSRDLIKLRNDSHPE